MLDIDIEELNVKMNSVLSAYESFTDIKRASYKAVTRRLLMMYIDNLINTLKEIKNDLKQYGN